MSATAQPAAPAAPRHLDATAVAMIIFLCLCWGFNQVAIKLVLPDVPPLLQGAIRSGGGAVLVTLWTWMRGISFSLKDGTLAGGLLAGFLFGLEFLLIYPGLQFTTASRATLFMYVAPFVVVIGSRWLVPGDHFRPSQWLGLLLSFAGLALAFGVPTPSDDPRQIVGDLMLLAAGVAWGATTLAVKASALNTARPEKTLLYQLVISVVMLGAGALALGETITHAPSVLTVTLLTYQTVWVVSVTFLIWFSMIVTYSASRLSAFTFLTPLFGVAAGHFVLGDPITPAFAGAVALVIAGLILVNRPK